MYSLYQNRYANKLHQNIIRVKYRDNHILQDKDFAIRLNTIPNEANDLITFKLYLYLGSLLIQNGLNDEILTLDTKILINALIILSNKQKSGALKNCMKKVLTFTLENQDFCF